MRVFPLVPPTPCPTHPRAHTLIHQHGKSTLADALVSKGGYLAKDKAGSACVLDNNEQEKARGITIYSTGISLEFVTPASLRGGGSAAAAAPAHAPTSEAATEAVAEAAPEPAPVPVAVLAATATATPIAAAAEGTSAPSIASRQLHLGNLPFSTHALGGPGAAPVTEAEVVAVLAPLGIRPTEVLVRPKRGFAFLGFPDAAAAGAAFRAWTPGFVTLRGRALTLAPRGTTARLRLLELCRARKWGPPKFLRCVEPGRGWEGWGGWAAGGGPVGFPCFGFTSGCRLGVLSWGGMRASDAANPLSVGEGLASLAPVLLVTASSLLPHSTSHHYSQHPPPTTTTTTVPVAQPMPSAPWAPTTCPLTPRARVLACAVA